MEEVDLKELFVYFIKRISIIICITTLCLITGIVYTKFIKTPLYEGSTTIILVNKSLDNNNNNTITQNDIVLNQKLVSTYTQIVKSKKVLKQVITNLSLNYSYSELYNHVSVSNVSDTEIIKIIVSNENPELASTIANNVAEVFKTEVSEIYHLENVTIIDKAEISEKPYNIKVVKTAGISFVGGLAISVMLLFVLYYFDTSIKSSEEVEKKLGIAVIGTIPHAGRRGK
ncbi:MAG: chain-length determining protein [Bacilli bacterium]|nr:chain-length determining protein [Bacilli bacterium]